MRSLVLPTGLALAFVLYFALPAAYGALIGPLRALYARLLRLCTSKQGAEVSALIAYAAVIILVIAFASAIHPVISALLIAPLFGALSRIPPAAAVKRGLDGGSHAGDVAAYEALVSDTCAQLAPAFAAEAFLPLLLCALGLALRLGGALGWAALGLRAVSSENRYARRVLAPLERAGERTLFALMLLCSCLVGRNPFRTKGDGVAARLLSVLGIAGDNTRVHPPMAGDIAQAAFLCCFCLCLLCLALALILFPLMR